MGRFSENYKTLGLSGTLSVASLFQMGYINSYPNTAIDSFRQFFNQSFINRGQSLSKEQFSFLWSFQLIVWFPGFLIGAWITPVITDRLGRRMGLCIANVGCVLSTLLTVTALWTELPELFMGSRAVCAIASGITLSSLLLFLQETAPTDIRGITSSFIELAMAISDVVGLIFGLRALLGKKLYILVSLAPISNVVSMLLLSVCKETPKHLLSAKNNEHAAMQSIKFYHGRNVKRFEKILNNMRLECEIGKNETSSLKEIWRTSYLRKAILIGTVSMSTQIVSGLWPISYLSTELFRGVDLSHSMSEIGSVIMIVANCVGTFFSLYLVERMGRRTLVLGCGSLDVICLSLFVIFGLLKDTIIIAKYACMVAVISYYLIYSLGLGPVGWFIVSELVPQRHRALVQSICLSIRCLIAMVVNFSILPLYNSLGPVSFVPILIIPSCLCLAFLYKEMPETKGKEVHDTVAKLSLANIKTSPETLRF